MPWTGYPDLAGAASASSRPDRAARSTGSRILRSRVRVRRSVSGRNQERRLGRVDRVVIVGPGHLGGGSERALTGEQVVHRSRLVTEGSVDPGPLQGRGDQAEASAGGLDPLASQGVRVGADGSRDGGATRLGPWSSRSGGG